MIGEIDAEQARRKPKPGDGIVQMVVGQVTTVWPPLGQPPGLGVASASITTGAARLT